MAWEQAPMPQQCFFFHWARRPASGPSRVFGQKQTRNKNEKRNYEKSIKRIVIIGRFVPQKRIDHAIKAFFLVQKKIKNCSFSYIFKF